jgi:salicylate hydroxylase
LSEAFAHSSKRRKVVIVGAGVAGSIVARRLSGIPSLDVICLERSSEFDYLGAGTALNVGPNGVKSLENSDPALAAAIASASIPWTTWRKSLANGRELFNISIRQVADRDGWRIRWNDLYRTLREGSAGCVRYGCKITQIGAYGTGRTLICWTDSEGDHVLDGIDLLVGADGRYSFTRQSFSGAPTVRQLGVAAFRMVVPDTSRGLIDDHEQWFNGPNRLLAFRVKPDHIYIVGSFPIEIGKAIEDASKTPAYLRATYTPSDAPATEEVGWLIDSICANLAKAHWARMQEHTMLYAEHGSAVLYLGDAAHGMVPTLGQGATQAIEDACFASDWISQAVADGRLEPSLWVAEIAELRSERMRFVMEFSRDSSDTLLAGADASAGIAKKMEADFLGQLSKLFHDVPLAADFPTTVAESPTANREHA